MPILNLNLSSMEGPQGMHSIQIPLKNFLKSCQPYKRTCARILPPQRPQRSEADVTDKKSDSANLTIYYSIPLKHMSRAHRIN